VVKRTRKILLAVDGSDQAFKAVRYMSRLFLPNHMKIVLFHVMIEFPENFWDIEKEPTHIHMPDPILSWELKHKKEIQEFMTSARQLFLDQNFPEDAVNIKIQAKKTGIARDIIQESYDDYDGVVVGRWGMSLLQEFLWGSIANKLMGRLTHVPLCVVGGNPQTVKILVAIDASKGAMRVVDYVGTMAGHADWEITLFHAVRVSDRDELSKDKRSMASVFEEASGHLEKAGVNRNRITTRMTTGVSSRAGAIVKEALNGEYGTIVVGRRGLSDVEDFIMGRVSNKVIHMANEMAVWVVP
jgi:nucleotide-binding universal stress UspA family protein